MCSWSVMGALKRSNSAQQVHNKTDVKIVCRQLQDSSIVVVVTLICVFVCYLYLIYLCYFVIMLRRPKLIFSLSQLMLLNYHY